MTEAEQAVELFMMELGWFAPLAFIVLHVIRPVLFLPVMVVCIAGGYLFGFLQGTLYSIIGLSLMSALFYWIIGLFPSFQQKLARLKKKLAGDRTMTIGQVMLLRVMPFVHFHLLSLYLMEMTNSYRDYMKFSVLGVVAPAALYTAFGEAIESMPWYVSAMFLSVLLGLFWLLEKRKKHPEQAEDV